MPPSPRRSARRTASAARRPTARPQARYAGREATTRSNWLLGFGADPCRAFLRAYRQHRPLSLEELDATARAYGLKHAYGLWLYEEIYQAGNDRVRQFVLPGDFVPVERAWQRLRSELEA
ncbi:MAG: hypothetical protein AB1505_12685 [Candidatus Latescibacterota bacterium]